MKRASAGLAVLALALMASAGLAGAAESPGMAHARLFHRYRLYYAGARLEGLPLTDVIERRYSRRRDPNWSFVYGDCTPDPTQDAASCTAPYEIQDWPICQRNPARYAPEARGRRLGSIRGAPVYRYDIDGLWLELYTGHTAVAVWGPDLRADKRALLALESVDGRIGAQAKLPRPARGALRGHLRCRR
jgi:hypothetical protein